MAATEALAKVTTGRAHIDYRQLLVVDAAGGVAVHSGPQVLGMWAEAVGVDCAAGGNLLANDGVPFAMIAGFAAATGHLGDRLMAALEAGLAAGGEAGPVHSAGLKLADRLSWPLLDLRIDWADDPIGMLRTAWDVYRPQMAAYVQRATDPTKAPSYGVPDADLDRAADMAAFGIFFNQGEVCSANSRMLVHASVADDMAERMVARAARYQPGDPLDPASKIGAMVDRAHADRVMGYFASGRQLARFLCGGGRVTINGSDAFIQPTIFIGAANDARIVQEEVFGPVLSIQTFTTEDEAIALANDTPFGLGASVWTRDLGRALTPSDRLFAGTVSVNTVDALSAMTPFGGMKQSGFGRDLSLHSFDKYTALKTTWVKYG